jgi:L-ribulokinase
MHKAERLALGLDFGTESVRALIVGLDGVEHASAAVKYSHGQIVDTLPTSGEKLPEDFALQHPQDWLDAATKAVRQAVKKSSAEPERIISIGVDFTSCTMLPALADGTPLCLTDRFARDKYAWPKLWKHHAAQPQTDRMNELARQRNEPWLGRYGGAIGLEWFFPKILETFDHSRRAYDAAEVWLEAGDWFVWQLVGGEASQLPRSTCQAGYKAQWNADEGYPSQDYFSALDPRLGKTLYDKLPGRLLSPGEAAGELTADMARKFGLQAGIPVSAAIIDAHSGVPGAGVAEPDTLVMVLGTSSCHMLNSEVERLVPGIAGVVKGGILPGYYGYETGQASVGDAFDWIRRIAGQKGFDELDRRAAEVPPGADGVLAIDWLNGCRTPLMDGDLTGALTGLSLNHGPEHLYRAMIEATACGLRWIVELLVDGGVPVKKLAATGGLPHHNPLLVQIYADVLGRPIVVPASKQGPALGAAILGVLSAGAQATGFRTPAAAIRAMTRGSGDEEIKTVRPNRQASRTYETLYRRYRELAAELSALRPDGA